MTVVTFSYIMQAPEGFRLHAGISNIIGILAAILFTVLFSIKVKKLSNSKLEA